MSGSREIDFVGLLKKQEALKKQCQEESAPIAEKYADMLLEYKTEREEIDRIQKEHDRKWMFDSRMKEYNKKMGAIKRKYKKLLAAL